MVLDINCMPQQKLHHYSLGITYVEMLMLNVYRLKGWYYANCVGCSNTIKIMIVMLSHCLSVFWLNLKNSLVALLGIICFNFKIESLEPLHLIGLPEYVNQILISWFITASQCLTTGVCGP